MIATAHQAASSGSCQAAAERQRLQRLGLHHPAQELPDPLGARRFGVQREQAVQQALAQDGAAVDRQPARRPRRRQPDAHQRRDDRGDNPERSAGDVRGDRARADDGPQPGDKRQLRQIPDDGRRRAPAGACVAQRRPHRSPGGPQPLALGHTLDAERRAQQRRGDIVSARTFDTSPLDRRRDPGARFDLGGRAQVRAQRRRIARDRLAVATDDVDAIAVRGDDAQQRARAAPHAHDCRRAGERPGARRGRDVGVGPLEALGRTQRDDARRVRDPRRQIVAPIERPQAALDRGRRRVCHR